MIIKIGGLKYEIHEIKNLGRDRDCIGEHCGNEVIINLDDSLNKQMKYKVLLHEIIEAINYNCELGLVHTQITILESSIFDIMINNKWFLEEVMKIE